MIPKTRKIQKERELMVRLTPKQAETLAARLKAGKRHVRVVLRVRTVADKVASVNVGFEEPIERSAPSGRRRRPIEDIVEELGAQVPAEEWAKLPADLTDPGMLDHYLYGLPKPTSNS